ncbi:RsmB/NOP family class I SAM-dependent RNA methyltransferase [Fundidesulfovibrio butyratiphilus]
MVCREAETPLVQALLASQGFRFEPEPFSPWCRRLTDEPFPLGASLAARFGLIYIQDRSSMLPPLALAPEPGAAVLDMCASPGGKTSFLAQLAGPTGFVLGNEPGQDRLATLRQNLTRMNLAQAATCAYPGQDLPAGQARWTRILLDPPCSGWGTAEKNPKVLTLWREEKTAPLTALQRLLLAKAADLLAPGGRILYSTCTTNTAENEEQVAFAVNELGLELRPLPRFAGFCFHEPALAQAEGSLRVDQEGSQAQGFYLALLVKSGEEAEDASGGRGRNSPPAPRDLGGDGLPGRSSGKRGSRRGEKKGEDEWAEVPCDEGFAWDALPPGRIQTRGDVAYFVSDRARGLLPPKMLGWRLGRMKGGRFRPWGRARILVDPKAARLDLDDPAPLAALLSGQSLDAPTRSGVLGLSFRGLPLGFLTVKNGRALWSDR